jgi:hypothetical protein
MKLLCDTPQNLKVADQKGRITLGSKYAGKHYAVREEADGSAVLTPVLVVLEKDAPLTARRLAESFHALESLKDNWDGRGSPAPSPALIASAREVVALLHAGALARGLHWTEPHPGANERGQIILEWWHGPRTLTLFVRTEDQVDYLKAWGSDIEHEMEDGEVSRLADFAALSRWLHQEEAHV